jgi:cytochrome c556
VNCRELTRTRNQVQRPAWIELAEGAMNMNQNFVRTDKLRFTSERSRAMKRRTVIGVLTLLSIGWLAAGGYGEPRKQLQDFMRVKLKNSQKVLEGLVLEDFEEIAKNAEEMNLLSLAETWQVLQTPDYVEYSRKFRNAADALSDMAKKKNLDQATVAYNQLTLKCVECHKYVRGVRMAKAK